LEKQSEDESAAPQPQASRARSARTPDASRTPGARPPTPAEPLDVLRSAARFSQEVSDAVARGLREYAWLLDVERVHARALLLALDASQTWARGSAGRESGLKQCVLQAARAALAEDLADERRGGPQSGTPERHGFLSRVYCVEAQQARSLAVRFNSLPLRARRAYFELVVHCRAVAAVMHECGCTREALGESLRSALDALYPDPPARGRSEKRPEGRRQ